MKIKMRCVAMRQGIRYGRGAVVDWDKETAQTYIATGQAEATDEDVTVDDATSDDADDGDDAPQPLAEMTIAELRALPEAANIDPAIRKKDDLIAAIEAVRQASA